MLSEALGPRRGRGEGRARARGRIYVAALVHAALHLLAGDAGADVAAQGFCEGHDPAHVVEADQVVLGGAVAVDGLEVVQRHPEARGGARGASPALHVAIGVSMMRHLDLVVLSHRGTSGARRA